MASVSGTAADPITLKGYPGDAKPVIRPIPGLSGPHSTFKIFTASFFNLRGFVIEGAYSDAAGCTAYNIWVSQVGAAHDVEITDNEVRGNTAGSGILTEASTARLKILRNSFHDNVDVVNCSGGQAHGMYIRGDETRRGQQPGLRQRRSGRRIRDPALSDGFWIGRVPEHSDRCSALLLHTALPGHAGQQHLRFQRRIRSGAGGDGMRDREQRPIPVGI